MYNYANMFSCGLNVDFGLRFSSPAEIFFIVNNFFYPFTFCFGINGKSPGTFRSLFSRVPFLFPFLADLYP